MLSSNEKVHKFTNAVWKHSCKMLQGHWDLDPIWFAQDNLFKVLQGFANCSSDPEQSSSDPSKGTFESDESGKSEFQKSSCFREVTYKFVLRYGKHNRLRTIFCERTQQNSTLVQARHGPSVGSTSRRTCRQVRVSFFIVSQFAWRCCKSSCLQKP